MLRHWLYGELSNEINQTENRIVTKGWFPTKCVKVDKNQKIKDNELKDEDIDENTKRVNTHIIKNIFSPYKITRVVDKNEQIKEVLIDNNNDKSKTD